MSARRGALACALLAAAVLGAGCGSDDAATGGTDGTGGDKPAAQAVTAPDSPQETLRQFAAAVADNDKAKACGLMLEGTRFTFAQEEEAPDCATAVSVLSSEIADKDAYKAMVPSGLEVTGDSAEISGYCGDGWRKADGEKYDGEGADPNDLGTLGLRKTENGWLVVEYRSDNRYSSCGG